MVALEKFKIFPVVSLQTLKRCISSQKCFALDLLEDIPVKILIFLELLGMVNSHPVISSSLFLMKCWQFSIS